MNNNRKKKNGKFLPAFLVSLMLANAGLPVFATEIFAGGADGYGAQINDLGGATINKNTGTEAQLGITGNGNIIKWDHLNVGAGNKLDFKFTQSGQVAVNKVNNGVSKFAGTVSTSGENGHLVISNPNGMIFMDGSVTNVDAGSATFTTNDVLWDGQKNGMMQMNANGANKGITIGTGTGPVPVYRVNKDLNIIAPGVDVTGADIFAGGTVRMTSADGINFVAGTHTPTVTANNTADPSKVQYARVGADGKTTFTQGNNNAIKVENTTVKATNSALVDGHLYLYAGSGDISLDNIKAGNINAHSGQTISIANSTTSGNKLSSINAGSNIEVKDNSNIKNAYFEAKGNVSSEGSRLTNATVQAKDIDVKTSIINDTKLSADNNINISTSSYLNNTAMKAVNKISTAGGEIAKNSSLTAKDIEVNSTTFRNSELNAENDILTNKWTYFHDSTATAANGNITINSGAGIYNTIFNAGGNITIDQAYISGILANANNGKITLLGNNATGNAGGTYNAKNIHVQGGAYDKATMNATDNIDIVGAGLYNGSKISAGNNLDITYGANIQDSSLTAKNDVSINGERAALYLKNTDINAVNGNIIVKNTGKGHGLGLESTKLTAGNNIEIANSYLNNMKQMDAGNSIKIENSNAFSNLIASAAKNINVNGLTSDANVKLMAADTIDIKNINAKGTISALNAANIAADTIKGNLVYLGGRTKDKAQQGITIGNSAWYEEWNPMASNIIANNIEADLDLRLLSTDKVVANNLKSGGDIHLVGNNVTASNINVIDQKILTHYPSTNTTTGLITQTYDSWADGWGLANNGGLGSILNLSNVNVDDKSAMVQVTGFETAKLNNIATPILLVESTKNVDLNNLKVDDMHFSNLYYALFGGAYFDLANLNKKNVSAFTQGRDITINQSFNPDDFDVNLDKTYGYKHNLLVLQYLNGDYDKVASKAKNTNLALVNYVDISKFNPSEPAVPGVDPGNNSGNTNNVSSDKTMFGFDLIEKIGEDIDTIFRQQFRHRGFAASDEEIEAKKLETIKNTVKSDKGGIKLMKEFKVH